MLLYGQHFGIGKHGAFSNFRPINLLIRMYLQALHRETVKACSR